MANPRPVRGRRNLVTADMSAAEAFRAIAGGCLAHLAANEAALVACRHPEALHQSRVAIRKLRASLTVFKPLLDKRLVKPARRDLAAAFDLFGRCRDLDIALTDDGANAAIETERAGAYDAAIARVRSRAYQNRLASMAAAVAEGDWLKGGKAWRAVAAMPIAAFAEPRLGKRLRRVASEGRGLRNLDADARHRLRIDVKNLRYAADFFAPLFDGRAARKRRKPFLAAIQALQERLGRLHDIQVRQQLAETPDKRTRGEKKREERLIGEAEGAFDALIEAGPFWS